MKTIRILLSLALLVCAMGVRAQEGTHWHCDIYDYEYDMAVYFSLQQGDAVVNDYSDFEVAAFVGDECRGVAEFQIITDTDNHTVQYGYIRIRSNQTEGETVTFRVYQTSTDMTLYVTENISFKNLEMEGLPSSPKVLHLSDVLLGDVNGDGFVDVADISAVRNHILGINNTVFLTEAADMNHDGGIDVSDLSAIRNIILGISF